MKKVGLTPRGPGDLSDPLEIAVQQRDAGVIDMVRRAIAERNVLLAFQPIVTAPKPDRIAYYEGLIRILDETGRVIPAKDFIGAIETTDIGRQIDCLALRLGLETLAAQPGLRLAINMSARSIGYRAWMDTLNYGLTLGPTVAERLILEITESSAMVMPSETLDFMDDLQCRSITFALDDFGAGYTSFKYLKEFFFDIIKIDGSFIRGIHRDRDNQVLTQALMTIGRHFEMFTVAEFVENQEDADFLASIGVDCLQGYLYGAPTTKPNWVVNPDRQVG